MTELYIDTSLADLDGVPSMAFTKTFETLTDPLTIRTAASKTVRLPATPRNNEIFSRIGRLDALTYSFDPRVKVPFVLTIDGMDMMLGYIKLTSIDWHLLEPRWYNITLFEATNDILRYMADIDISDISMPSNNISHVIDKNAIVNPPQDGIYFLSYQGQYEAFENGKYEAGHNPPEGINPGDVVDYDRDYDENELQEYRSYYQRFAMKFSTIFTAMMAAMPWLTNCSPGVTESPYYGNTVICLPPAFKEGEASIYEGFIHKTIGYPWDIPFESTPVAEIETTPDTRTDVQPLPWDLVTSDERYDTDGRIDLTGLASNDVVRINATLRLFGNFQFGVDINNDREFHIEGINGAINPNIVSIYLDITDRNGSLIDSYQVLVTNGRNIIGTIKANQSLPWHECHIINGEEILTEIPIDYSIYVGSNTEIFTKLRLVYENTGAMMWWRREGSNYQAIGGNLIATLTFESKSSITSQKAIRSGGEVNWSSMMPKGKTQLDLLSSYIKTFGYIADYDSINRRLNIMTRNEYFSDYRIEDWTHKIDYSQPVSINPLTFDYRFGSLEHTPSENYRNDKYVATNGQNYGEQLIDTGFGFNDTEKSLLGDSFFTSAIMSSEYGRMFNGRSDEIGRDDKILPLIADRDGAEWKSIDESLQLMFDNGMVACKPYRITDDTAQMVGNNSFMWYATGDDTSNSIVMDTYRQLSRVKNNYGSIYSLDFGKPSETYYASTDADYPENSTIYARMWQEYLRERLSVNTRVMTAQVYLTSAEFFGWKFNSFVQVEDTLWHVNKIEDFDPLINKITKVELVRVNDINAYINGQKLT